jgi:hypothetical protein
MVRAVIRRPPTAENRVPAQVNTYVWDLWWAKWHEYFGFPLSVSFHQALRTHMSEG